MALALQATEPKVVPKVVPTKVVHGFSNICSLIDVYLRYPDEKNRYENDLNILTYNADIDVFTEKLEGANIIGLSHEFYPFWRNKLLLLSTLLKSHPSIIIFFGTDISFRNEDIEDVLNAFPDTHFWITNFVGNHPRCKILPLGVVSYDGSISSNDKDRMLCITYMRPHCEERTNLFSFVEGKPLQKYTYPFLENNEYNTVLARSYFSVCPSGNGYDTYRFWESLCYKAIPIVKKNEFYTALRRQYPALPFLSLERWEELPVILNDLSVEYYESLWKNADISCCWAGDYSGHTPEPI